MQIARDWTGFWGFDGYFRCLCDILGVMDGEGINKLINEGTFMSQRRYLRKIQTFSRPWYDNFYDGERKQ